MEITWNQRNIRYDNATAIVKHMYVSEEVGQTLYETFTRNDLKEEQYKAYVTVIGDIILGFHPKSELDSLLVKNVGISEEIAHNIAVDLADFLKPVGEESTTIPVPISTTDPTPIPSHKQISTPPRALPPIPSQEKIPVPLRTELPTPSTLLTPPTSTETGGKPPSVATPQHAAAIRERLHLRPATTKETPAMPETLVVPSREAAVRRTMKADIAAVKGTVTTDTERKAGNSPAPVTEIPRFRKPFVDQPRSEKKQ